MTFIKILFNKKLSLFLFMFWIGTNYHNSLSSTNQPTIIAYFFNRSADFHFDISYFHVIYTIKKIILSFLIYYIFDIFD
jgi:hypothetical protein